MFPLCFYWERSSSTEPCWASQKTGMLQIHRDSCGINTGEPKQPLAPAPHSLPPFLNSPTGCSAPREKVLKSSDLLPQELFWEEPNILKRRILDIRNFPFFFKFYFRAKQQSRTRTPSTEQNQASQQRPSPSSRSLGTAGYSQLRPFFLLEKPLRIVGKDEIHNQSSNFIFRLLNSLFGGLPRSKSLGSTTRTPELHEGIPG